MAVITLVLLTWSHFYVLIKLNIFSAPLLCVLSPHFSSLWKTNDRRWEITVDINAFILPNSSYIHRNNDSHELNGNLSFKKRGLTLQLRFRRVWTNTTWGLKGVWFSQRRWLLWEKWLSTHRNCVRQDLKVQACRIYGQKLNTKFILITHPDTAGPPPRCPPQTGRTKRWL